MSDEHNAAKMAAGAAAVSMAFFAVGTPEESNAPRLANRSDWERCLKHPIHPVERAPGQTKAANFAYNWTDGARVVLIWGPILLLAFWGLLWVLSLMGDLMITKLLVIEQHPDGGRPIQIYDEEWFYAIRTAERSARRSRKGSPTQAD